MTMQASAFQIWLIIILLGIGTYLLRWSFLGALGNRELPGWVMRMLRYTPVSVLPALVAPLVVWPAATGGETDPARLGAALAALAVGLATRHVLWAILAAFGSLYSLLWLFG